MRAHLLATTAIIAALSLTTACKPKATDLPPGQYENTTKSTDSSGTEHEKTTITDVQQNSDGTKDATVHQETTQDPPGLLNKTTTSDTTVHEHSQ